MALGALMQCLRASDSVERLQEEFCEVHSSQSAAAADLAEIEKHLAAELPVSHRCNERCSESSSEIVMFNHSDFIIASSRSF